MLDRAVNKDEPWLHCVALHLAELKPRWFTYLCFPKIGLRPMMTLAKALLTCWFGSATNSFTYGKILFIIIVSCCAWSKFWQKSFTLFAAAALTSASTSFNNDWNAWTKSVFVISGPRGRKTQKYQVKTFLSFLKTKQNLKCPFRLHMSKAIS